MKNKIVSFIGLIGFAVLFLAMADKTYAATFFLSPAGGTFKKGCSNTAYVVVNTQGVASNAADAFLTYDAGKIEVTGVRAGNAYGTYLAPSYGGGRISLTAFTVGSSLNGSATYMSITFKSVGDSADGGFGWIFSPGSTTDSNVADLDSNDILSGVGNGNYTFEEGECVVDTSGPYVTAQSPGSGATAVPLDANVSFHLKDNDPGVNPSTIRVTVNGTEYSDGTAGFSMSGTAKDYAITIDPPDFGMDMKIDVSVTAKDTKNNAGGGSWSFFTPATPVPPPVPPTCEELGCTFEAVECPPPPPAPACGVGGAAVGLPAEMQPTQNLTGGIRPAAPPAMTVQVTGETIAENKDECRKVSDVLDSDGDGLMDRTECYRKTNPNNRDSDGDGCLDGDEINLFRTNPLYAEDCALRSIIDQRVVITDPQENWIVRGPTIVAGLAPEATESVSVFAYRANYYFIKDVISAMEELRETMLKSDVVAIKNGTERLLTAIESADKFLTTAMGDDNTQFAEIISRLKVKAEALNAKANESILKGETKAMLTHDFNFPIAVDMLKKLLRAPTTLGTSENFSLAALGSQSMARFAFENIRKLENNTYELMAKATMSDGKSMLSPSLRFHVDWDRTVAAPIPTSIGGVPIQNTLPATVTGEENQTPPANANVIEIDDAKPVITGSSEFGSQVFAVWQSVVLNSSVISDSEEGSFSIQAPSNMEKGVTHKVTLYAIKNDKGDKFRSDNVDIFFRIKGQPAASNLPYIIGGALLALILLSLIVLLIRKLKRNGNVEIVPEAHKSAAESAKAFEKK